MDAVTTVAIDREKDEPAYEQIARQIRARIAAGELRAGMLLPGVRTLAADLGVNLNTVARAYRLLADQRFVRIRDRSGVEVSAPATEPAPETSASLEAELEGLLVRMRQAGLPAEAVRRIIDTKLGTPSNSRTESEK
jgi:GntR family transcriptional regulator